jgi:hypothetical protein
MYVCLRTLPACRYSFCLRVHLFYSVLLSDRSMGTHTCLIGCVQVHDSQGRVVLDSLMEGHRIEWAFKGN